MTHQRPLVPEDLRRDPGALARAGRTSISRAVTSLLLAKSHNMAPGELLRRTWPDDAGAAVVLKAAQDPLATTDFPGQSLVTALRRLAPTSVALRVFEQALQVDLAGLNTVKVPIVATAPTASFVGEMAPAPMLQLGLGDLTVGPVRKLLVQAALTDEVEAATPEAASGVISKVLGDATALAIDAAAFDAVAGDDVRPPGLLYGATPIAAAAAAGSAIDVAAADVANLIGAIADAGIDTAGAIIVGNPREATKLVMLAGPAFDIPVFGCAAVPPKRVIAIAPAGVGIGYKGTPQISTSREAEIHFESSPQPVPAPPTLSAFQSALLVVRVRSWCAWSAAPGAAQYVDTVNW